MHWCLADFKEEKKGKKRKKESLQDIDAPEQEMDDGAKSNQDEKM